MDSFPECSGAFSMDDPYLVQVSHHGIINNKRGMGKALNIQPEINVLGMTVAEATSLVDRYLDDAMLAHLHKVRI